MKTARTDIHRPSTMDPADYTAVGDLDTGSSDDPGYFYLDAEVTEQLNSGIVSYFNEAVGSCDHCGHRHVRYFVIYLHHPTQKLVCVGLQCAVRLGAENLSQLQMKKRAEANKRRALVLTWRAESADNEAAWSFLTEQVEGNGNYGGGFYFDLLHKLNRYGSLSEKQVAAVLRSRDRDAEFAAKREAERATASPVITGRVEITGEILSSKFQDSDFGGSLKMLVKDDRGFKVWGTVPASLEDAMWAEGAPEGGTTPERLKGQRVTFTASVEASRDDETFGFFKRPSAAQVIA